MLDCGFAEFLYRGLSLSFKAQCLPQIETVLCLAGCHVVAQTQAITCYAFGEPGYISGGEVVLKFDVIVRHCYAVFCAVCMQAMTHSVDNVPSQQAVKLVILEPGFVEHCWFGLFLGDQWQ